ncbi:MAG: DEAD/DEAH box helicase [Ardenticatenales bacterium]|nr:DEAD/DEAH box helicase [Ardenticatenales bacterium]
MSNPLDLKAKLGHTWVPFFARHGNFTEVQRQAIPAILSGHNTLVMAATASGKTEAVLAPLLERHVFSEKTASELRVLYLCPTRALVRDLYLRLAAPCKEMRVRLAMKSGDTGPLSSRNPPTILLTTPESTDSLLTRVPRLFVYLRAVVLDEIHLFDGSVRGDQLWCLLQRIERIRAYHQQTAGIPGERPLQRIALSATVPDPTGIAARYLESAKATTRIVHVPGGRAIEADMVPISALAELTSALNERASHKTLLFCNTRNEVEQVAVYLRQHLGYEARIFVHYSNLDARERRQTETEFAKAAIALCVSSSTLELGIDIGDIDDIVLLGPPPDTTSFLQRIGRGARRQNRTPVLCLARSSLEVLRFAALLALAKVPGGSIIPGHPSPYTFRPSVLVQQTFSLLKQSPTGGLRLADLRALAPHEIEESSLHAILNHLGMTDHLRQGRPGEWRAGTALDELVDAHEIYSNLGGELLGATVIDAYTGRPIARAERPRSKGEKLLIGGRPVEVAWRAGRRFAIKAGQGEAEEVLRFHTPPFAVPLEVTQAMGAQLGLHPGQMPCMPMEEGVCLFHFWGDLYGELLAALLELYLDAAPGEVEPWNEVALMIPRPLRALPPWDDVQVAQELERLTPSFEPYLGLGCFHSLLPPMLARDTTISCCNLPRFQSIYQAATLVTPAALLEERLWSLL